MVRMLAIAVMMGLPFASVAQAEQMPPVITVTGDGQVTAEPDMAQIRLGVTHQDMDAADAMDRVSADVRKLFETVEEFGIEPRDLQTASLRLDTIWESRRSNESAPPRIAGFVASNDISIRVRDFARLGELLDRLLRDGANQFSGVSFSVQDPTPLVDEARRRAVADARRKAELYAEAAGLSLEQVLEIREPGSDAAPVPRMARMESVMDQAAMPVAGGEVSFSAQITIIFSLGQ